MTNSRSPSLTSWPSSNNRFCKNPSTRARNSTLSRAWTRPVKVTDGLMSCLATATTVTAGGGGGASACWSWRPQADTHATAIAVVTTRQRANTRIVLPRLAHPNGQTNRLRGPDLPTDYCCGPEGYAVCMVQYVAAIAPCKDSAG